MSQTASDRAVRKALLQAHAEIERIELARSVADVREAVSPRSLMHQFLPFSFGAGGSTASRFAGSGLTQVASQIGNLYERYPMIWSTVASLFLGRGRIGRVVKVLGLVLAARKAVRVRRGRGRSVRR